MICPVCSTQYTPVCPNCGWDREPLTAAELAVLRLCCTGDYTVEQMASERGVTHATVKTQLTHLHRKFGVRTRAGLVAEAYQRGIVRAETPKK